MNEFPYSFTKFINFSSSSPNDEYCISHYFHKNIQCPPYLRSVYFLHNLLFFLPPILTIMQLRVMLYACWTPCLQ